MVDHRRFDDVNTGEGQFSMAMGGHVAGKPGKTGDTVFFVDPDLIEGGAIMHGQRRHRPAGSVMAIHAGKINIGDDIGIDHQKGGLVPKVGQLAKRPPRAQNVRLMADPDGQAEVRLGQISFDAMGQMVDVYRNGLTTRRFQLVDHSAEHRLTGNGKQGLGERFGEWGQAGPESGGQDQCPHGITRARSFSMIA